jgi:hypothetical protein
MLWPFKRRKPETIVDEELGELFLDGDWCIRRSVEPVGEIELCLRGATSLEGRQLLRELGKRLAELMKGPVLEELMELEGNAERGTSREQIFDVYKAQRATIERSSDEIVIEVGFTPSGSDDD